MTGSPPRLFLRHAARREIASAFRWYEARSTGLGHEFLRAVAVTLAGIERAPQQYPIAIDDVRKAPLRRFPYVAYFVALPSATSVIALMHGRRHPQRWQARR